jgi:hypothetical protein
MYVLTEFQQKFPDVDIPVTPAAHYLVNFKLRDKY